MQYQDSYDPKFVNEPRATEFSAFVEPTPLAALSHILGCTEKQLSLAGEILSRFTWHSPSQHGQSAKRIGAESDGRERAA